MSNEELVKQIQQGVNTSCNMESLYINNKSYIYQIAKKYMNYADIEDLMQEGYLGLYEAVQRYEDSHEVLFMTYAGFWIQQVMRRYIDNNNRNIRLSVGLQGQIYQYQKISNAYESQLQRKPTDRELCVYLGIDSKRLKKLKLAIYQFNNLDSLDREIRSEDGSILLGDSVKDKLNLEDNAINNVMDKALKTELWKIVKDNTTSEENKVLHCRFKQALTLDATGQLIGKSREMVRNIEAKALRKMRRPKVTRMLKDKFEINFANAYKGSLSSFNYTWTSSTESVAMKNYEIGL